MIFNINILFKFTELVDDKLNYLHVWTDTTACIGCKIIKGNIKT